MKAVVLYSGGLDSTLALAIVKEWGAEAYPVHFSHKFLATKLPANVPNLKVIDLTADLIKIIRNPKFGFGRNLNPCIDCRIAMLRKAKKYMKEVKADFIVTGEVLDQRPMSQRFDVMLNIEREVGLEGMIVRPLSDGLLPPTIPLKDGLIKPEGLLKIRGRSRKFELHLAQEKKIKGFFSPAGGCLLCDRSFARRLADFMRYEDNITPADLELLQVGRHFRVAPDAKIIAGRNQVENERIEKLFRPGMYLLVVPATGSPSVLLKGDKKYLKTAAAITARYSDKKGDATVAVEYRHNKSCKTVAVKPASDEELEPWRIQ